MSSSGSTVLKSGPELLVGDEPDTQSWAPVTGVVTPPSQNGELPSHVAHRVISSSSALGAGIFIERGTGLLANIIAARLGGTGTFGAYSLAITTANNISTYAAGGIGGTAARFSGKYPRGSKGYPTLVTSLVIVSVVSAVIAFIGLWFGATPIAHILAKTNLTTLLRWASISAAGVVLMECARGFFTGQRSVGALLTLSICVGLGMITLIPLAAHRHRPIEMIVLQGTISVVAVIVCALLSKPLKLRAPEPLKEKVPLLPVLREVWTFGFVQLSGLISCNLAGWWLTTLVARADTTLTQMSFFTIASQLRNIVALAPSLLTEGSYAVMADPEHESSQTPQRVMALCTFAALSISVLLGALGILIVPWILDLLYGRAYEAASLTVAVALATAVAHMGMAPAAARLTIVSIRSTAIINTVWALFVGITSTVLLLRGGSAWHAMAIYFIAHVISAVQVLSVLRKRDNLPRGMILLFTTSTVAIAGVATLSLLRSSRPDLQLPITLAIACGFLLSAAALYVMGRRYDWLPRKQAVMQILEKFNFPFSGRLRRV